MTQRRHQRQFAGYQARHFLWQLDSGSPKVAVLTLDRPDKKNPLTFDSYAELRDLFRGLQYAEDIKVVVITGAGGNFSSGGDVRQIIGPLTRMSMPELLDFTRMTGDLVKAMRACPQPIVAAVEGICAGAGAMIALASDLRFVRAPDLHVQLAEVAEQVALHVPVARLASQCERALVVRQRFIHVSFDDIDIAQTTVRHAFQLRISEFARHLDC